MKQKVLTYEQIAAITHGGNPGKVDMVSVLGLWVALNKLDPKHRKALLLYFGVDGPPLTLEGCGLVLGVKKERARQLKEGALRRLGNMPLKQHLTKKREVGR